MEVVADELRPKTTPSVPANPDPNAKVREEGELSSADEHEDQACSASECNSIDGSAGPIPVPPSNKCSQDSQVGKNISDNNPASTVEIHSRAPVQPVARKTFDKSRIQSRTNAPGPSGATHNLVIRFSDDESGSDSEGCTHEKAAETKSSTTGVLSNRKPPAPLPSKSNYQNTMIASKVTPQRSSISRPVISSTTKTAVTTSRSAGTLPVELGSQVKNFNVINKNISGRERGMDLKSSKLQDLRQQIALRESELKLKSAQRSKESVPFRDDNTMTLLSDTAIKFKSAQIEPKEPERKRKKVSGSYSAQPNLVGSQEILVRNPVSPAKEPAMHNNSIPVAVTFDYGQEGNSASRTDLNIVKWNKQNEKQVAGVSENIPATGLRYGGNAMTNCVQSDGNSKQMEFSRILNQSTPATMNFQGFRKNNVELNPSKNQQASSLSNKAILGSDLVRDNNHDILSNSKRLEPALNSTYQEYPNNESLWNCLSNANVSEHRSVNMQSLVEMEESLDKDLEEAQEHRRMCEIEERNALKAYRKAQRALVEANARCNDLYHKRELYSAKLRSFMISDSSLLCSSSQNEKVGIGYSNDASGDLLIIPSSHQLQPDSYGFNPPEIDSNFQYLNAVPVQPSFGQGNARSEPCSEPDASTSDPLSHRGKAAADGFLSPSSNPNISGDEDDETLSIERVAVHHGLDHPSKNNFDDGKKNVNEEPSRKSTIDSPLDSLLLEATLRSELFARMGAKNSKNNGSSDNIHLTFEERTENEASNGKTQANLGSLPLSHAEPKSGGPDGQEKSNAEAPVEMQHGCSIGNDCLNSCVLVDSGVNEISGKEGSGVLVSEILTFNIFRSAFSHLKIISPKTLMEWLSRNRQNYTSEIYSKVGASIVFDKMDWNNSKADSTCESIIEVCGSKTGSYTCEIAVDPLWPLCMYELRGKCNNDECPWQHARDNGTIMSNHQLGDSDGDAKVPKHCDIMVSPTYLVGLDTLKVDRPVYESVLAWRNGQGWQKCFSRSLTLSNLFQKDLPLHGPLSYCSDGRIEVHGSWSRQSSYLSRSDRLNQLKQSTVDNEQALEMAILIFNQEADKHEGMKKALPVVSRALEVDPRSINLWMFYLLIYHRNMKSVVADDMFSYAVKYNEGSYELWLMYINSRLHLDDHLVTYDEALRSLCRHASASDLDGMHASACILDLFLQMIDCLCMSGNVENAIQKIVEFSSAVQNSHSPPRLLSDVHSCLNISDKCIFWVCCVYLVIYRKLPDAIVRQCECEKQLLEIEWYSILLLDDEKQRAVEVMEKGADSVASLMETESLKSDSDLRLAHLFAVNHIRCMAALDSLECCTNLLDKYLRLYPSCFELVLISTRSNKQDFGGEETLNNWPKERSGIHCIWNQYAEFVLQNGQKEFVKELMDRWFHSVWKVNDPEDGRMHGPDAKNKDGLLESSSDSITETPSGDQIDQVFGFLNLSLHKLLQNDRIGAHIELEKALEAAFPKYLKHCIREHATFLLTDEPLTKENASINGILNILKHHARDSQIFCITEPLPRKFINKIKKPRVQQLMSNIFSPVSFDFSLVNLVLEVWFGPSLLPEEFNEPKHMVDFVEGILDIWPSNYELALSVCKMLSSKNSTDVSAPVSMIFWASSNLVNATFHAVPIPPEHIWVEAARILGKVAGVDAISQVLHRRALTVYPFSVKLWKSYQILYVKMGGDAITITEEAKAKGIDLSKSF